MAYTTGTATNYLDLMDKLRRFAAGFGTAGTPTPGSNTGNGTVTGVDTTAATVTETWTLTCTAGGPTGTFSVVGSVSGAQADATVGTPYSNSRISFTINDGAVDFIIGDTFTIATTIGALAAAGEEWAVERWTGGNELVLRGQGLDATQEIYVGMKGEFNVGADYYNWDCRGFTGYSVDTFSTLPGASRATYLSLWNSSIPYWFVVNGQRIIVVAKVSTTYHIGYFGYWYPYGQPSAFPYPVLIAASTGIQATRWSATTNDHSNLTAPDYAVSTQPTQPSTVFYDVSGAWCPISRRDLTAGVTAGEAKMHPWCYGWSTTRSLAQIDKNADGSYPVMPAIIRQSLPAENLLGELDGVYWTTGQSAASEDLIDIGGTNYLVVQNIHRTSRGDYCAIKLA